MKKAIVAMGLALSLIVGNIAVYADTKVEVKPVETVVEAKENIDFSSLKDDNASLSSKEESNFMKDFAVPSDRKYNLIINGHLVYDNYFEDVPGGGKTNGAYLHSDKGTIVIPLFFTSQMMGASLKGRNGNTVTFEKDGKEFTFEVGSSSYREGDSLKKLRYPIVNYDGMWCAAFYDLVDIYKMLFRIDYGPAVKTFDHTKLTSGLKKNIHVQVIVWDKDMKLFKKSNPEVKKFIKNIDDWYSLRRDRLGYEFASDLHYILLDTKTKKGFTISENINKDAIDVVSHNRWLNGFGYIIKNKKITHDLFGDPVAKSYYSWHSNKNMRYKNGEEQPFVDLVTFKEADMFGFHGAKSNVMTVYINRKAEVKQ